MFLLLHYYTVGGPLNKDHIPCMLDRTVRRVALLMRGSVEHLLADSRCTPCS